MNEGDKLRVLLPHWIEHNQEHAKEFRRWTDVAGEGAEDIIEAASAMVHVNEALENALEKLGGALPHDHLHHHEHKNFE